MAATIATDSVEYSIESTVGIAGSSFQAGETVYIVVTFADGSPLPAGVMSSWEVTADGPGVLPGGVIDAGSEIERPGEDGFLTSWIMANEIKPGDILLLTATGGGSGAEASTAMTVKKYVAHHLQNSTGGWHYGNINNTNSCYGEDSNVPYRFFAYNLTASSTHSFQIDYQATKGGFHGLDYLSEYDLTESGPIATFGGECSSTAKPAPADCATPTAVAAFPDPTSAGSYASAVPVELADIVSGFFAVSGPGSLYAYNATNVSFSQISIGGTASDRILSITVTFEAIGAGSAGFYWGGHIATSQPDTWGAGQGAAGIAGAPYHMASGKLDGSGGMANLSIKGLDICVPPDISLICDSGPYCTGSTHTCSVPAGADSYDWTVTGGTIVSGQNTSSITYTVTASAGDPITVSVNGCDITTGCGSDGCCSEASVEFVAADCCEVTLSCPDDLAIECDASIDPSNTGGEATYTVTGVCPDPITVSYTDTEAAGSCANEKIITRVWSATDGNSEVRAQCTQTITVVDTTPPELVGCPADVSVECDAVPAVATVTATDNCDPAPTVVFTETTAGTKPVDCTGEYVLTRTWTATDDCGNVATCVQKVTVSDTQPPELTCPDPITVECLGDVPAPDVDLVTATDNCDPAPAITFLSDVSDGQSCPETITRTYKAVDDCGNIGTCTQIITVDDTTPPVATCPADVTVDCVANIPAVNTGAVTATDNCDPNPAVVFLGDVSDGQSCPETITRTYQAEDDCGNTSICTQTITVDDTTPPVATCPADVTVDCAADIPGPNAGAVTAVDNCDPNPGVVFVGDVSDGLSCPETITRTYRATDFCGNEGLCQQIITIDDQTPPVITCPPDIDVVCDGPTDPGVTGTATATDNCVGAITIAYTDNISGGIIRTWTATDACGNQSSCVQTITVTGDNVPPEFSCPADVTYSCLENIPAAAPGSINATDNCDPNPTVTLWSEVQSGSTCPITITRTFRAYDASGNFFECSQVITVDDQTPPELGDCPDNIIISCDDPVPAPANVTATDNCDGVTLIFDQSEVAGNCPQERIITRTWTATDACGNEVRCLQTITIEDNTPPTIACPGPITVECTDDVPAPNMALVTANDNCDPAPNVLFWGDVSDGQTCPETITRTYKAIDDCGNIAFCTQTITVNDVTAPVVTCPADVVVDCMGDVPPSDIGLVTATDNCDAAPVVTLVSDVQNGNGCPLTITRTYRATDACGNFAECSQTITVDDQTPPQITCPGPITVECSDDVPAQNTALVTVFDNCDPAPNVLFWGDVSDGQTCPETITRTYKAIDDCGNIAFCEQIIIVDDQTPPVITCPADLSIDCAAGAPQPDIGLVTATDNCDPAPVITFVGDVQSGSGCALTITRTYRATDACGNFAECSQTISADDQTPPQITCPADVAVDCMGEVPEPNTGSVTATDNCDPAPAVAFIEDVQNGSGCPLTITRTYRVTDACGNFALCYQTITVDDQTPPQITCPADVTVECADDVLAPDIGMVTATDDCGTPVVAFVDDVSDGQTCPETITRTYKATDDCGNEAFCEQIITVDDQTPPVLSGCPADVTVDCGNIPAPAPVTAWDNCDGDLEPGLVETTTPGSCDYNYTVTRTWTATDACGNPAECTQTITVQDVAPPTLTLPEDIDEILCETREICRPVTASDNCDPLPTLTVVDGPGAIVDGQWCYTPPPGTNSGFVFIRAEDACGNVMEGDFQFSFTINQAPSFDDCPDGATINWRETLVLELSATDPDDGQTETLTYSLCEGAPEGATIDESTGHFEWTPTADDICDPTICVIVTDECQVTAECSFDVCVSNHPPVITCPGDVTVCNGFPLETQVSMTDLDNGPAAFFRFISKPDGMHIDAVTGVITWESPTPGAHEVCVEAYDGAAECDPCSPASSDMCCFTVNVVALDLVIEKVHEQFQNHRTEVSIDFLNQGNNWPVAGYDLLIQYDPTALTFLKATEGQFLLECDWEYFTYRFGASGNCGPGACPTGVLRIVTLAETNGGNMADHPSCFTNDGVAAPGPGSSTATELAVMHFMVTDDRTVECSFAPIRFVWYDCGDNALSSITGDTLYISHEIYDYGGETGDPSVVQWNPITGLDNTFPTVTGAPAPDCDLSLKAELVRCANFHNGGVDIICADEIDAVGDINVNGIAYEIADAVMLTNYFINGLSAFADCDGLVDEALTACQRRQEGGIAASDTNVDGITLSVADLVYLIRVVIGDAMPYAKVNPFGEQVSYTLDNGIIAITDDIDISGAALVVRGNVAPQLLVEGLNLRYAFDGSNTRIVVVPPVDAVMMPSFRGAFLSGIDRELISLELSTSEGAMVVAKNVPIRYHLTQNYPNPFNPVTTIEFALPEPTDYSLTIFNIQGQVVGTHEGHANAAGVFRFEWEAGEHASGVYLYRLEAGAFTQTKKMLLLK